MEVWSLEQAAEQIELLEKRVSLLEERLNSLSSSANESNLRSSIAQALRGIADGIEEDEEDLALPSRVDPNEED